MGAFYALLAAGTVIVVTLMITLAVLIATGNYTGTFKRNQAKPKQAASK